MNTTIEKLFDTYGESALKDLNRFSDQKIASILNSFPVEESQRLDLLDEISRSYLEWSTNAFAVGLHLGLSLLNDNICRPRPQKG